MFVESTIKLADSPSQDVEVYVIKGLKLMKPLGRLIEIHETGLEGQIQYSRKFRSQNRVHSFLIRLARKNTNMLQPVSLK
ncbi:MAG: hypothetical protein QXK94_05490 [Candidatus Jordarchaeales archaeon]